MYRTYYDFEPDCQYKTGEAQDIIQIQVKDFKKENLRVHLGSNGVLTVSGERPVEGRWIRFQKEFNPPKDCKANEIRARLSSGILFITIPKKVPPQVPQQDSLTPVQKAPLSSSSSSSMQDKGKLQQESSNQSKDQLDAAAAPAETFPAKQSSFGDHVMNRPTENAAASSNVATKTSFISRLKMERKTAIKVVASVIVLSLLFVGLFYVFKFYVPMIMNV